MHVHREIDYRTLFPWQHELHCPMGNDAYTCTILTSGTCGHRPQPLRSRGDELERSPVQAVTAGVFSPGIPSAFSFAPLSLGI